MSVHRFIMPLSIALLCAPLSVAAASPATPPAPATLMVVGHADVKQAPDRAVVRAEILTSDKTAAGARAKNDAISAKVVTAIAAAGLPDRALRTTNFESSFVPRGKDTPADAVTGYLSRREVEVATTPDRIEAVTHAFNESGVYQVNGVSTEVMQHKNAYEQTLGIAMSDAQLQAQVIARAAHLKLVRVLNVDATGAPVFAPRMMMTRAMKDEAPVPAPADVNLSATVNVTYEIAPQ